MPKKGNKRQKRELPDPKIIVHQYPSFIEWAGNLSLSISSSRAILVISLVLLGLSLIAYYPTQGEDYDIWFHLAYGKHYVDNLTWAIDHSQFSWTPSLPDWKYVTWIGSSILYISYQVASVQGLYIVQWLILLGIGFLYLYYIKSESGTIELNHVLGLFLAGISINLAANYIKPELFTTLFFAIALFIYFRAKSSSKNLFFLYPILFLIWVNTHGGFIIGLFFISAAVCGEAVNVFFLKKASLARPLLKHFAIAALLSYVAILFNPYGMAYHTELFNYLFSKEYMGEATQLFAYFRMWDFLFPQTYMYRFMNTAWCMILMGALFIALNIYAYIKHKYVDFSLWALNVCFFYLGMQTARMILFFPFLWLFSMLYILKKGDVYNAVEKRFKPIALILILFFSGNIFYHTLVYYDHRSWFGFNLNEWLPVKEVEFIKKHKIQGPIFNDYIIGGYMIWAAYPEYKVFIDPRYGPYIKQIWPDWLDLKNNLNPEGLKKFTSKYPFKSALIHLREPYIIFWLLSSPEWRLAYFDKTAAVIIHTSLIPSLSPEALATDVSPQRFKNLTNPHLLLRLFDFYINIGPGYAKEIVNIFNQNVSSLYKFKSVKIQELEALIKQKELKLQQRQTHQQTKDRK